MHYYRRCGCPSMHRVTSAYSDCCCCPHCIEMAAGHISVINANYIHSESHRLAFGTSSTLFAEITHSKPSSVCRPTHHLMCGIQRAPSRSHNLFKCFANSHNELLLFHWTSCKHGPCHNDALFSARWELQFGHSSRRNSNFCQVTTKIG